MVKSELQMPAALAVVLLLAACAGGTSDANPGSLEFDPTTTSAVVSTTGPQVETTTTDMREETTTSTASQAPVEEVAGTYEARDAKREGFLLIMDDGTLHWAPDETGPQIVLDARFEETSVLITDPDCGEDVTGVYEFRLLETGDLEVVLIEDACSGRASNLAGRYTPVE